MLPSDVLKPTHARINQAARTRGLTRDQIYKLINAGEIEASKVGRATLIRLSTLDAYLERQRITGKFPSADEMRRRRKIRTDRSHQSSRSLLSGDAS